MLIHYFYKLRVHSKIGIYSVMVFIMGNNAHVVVKKKPNTKYVSYYYFYYLFTVYDGKKIPAVKIIHKEIGDSKFCILLIHSNDLK